MKSLVVVFLRGGMDGGSAVFPCPDEPSREGYLKARPRINFESDLDLGQGLALHKSLEPIFPYFQSGDLSIYAGISGHVRQRSHFIQQPLVESGATEGTPLPGGFFGRKLSEMMELTPWSCVALEQSAAARSINGAFTEALPIPNPKNFDILWNRDLHIPSGLIEKMLEQNCPGELCDEATSAMKAVKAGDFLKKVQLANRPTGFRRLMLRHAQYLNADKDRLMKLLSVDMGGWDTHRDQLRVLPIRFTELSEALKLFWDELTEERKDDTSVLVISEFGRTFKDNGNGTDHGYGGVSFLLSRVIQEGLVQEDWWDMSEDSEFKLEGEELNHLRPSMRFNDLFQKIVDCYT